MTRIVIVSGGLREPSTTRMLADRLGEATLSALAERGVRATVQVVELRPLARDIADAMVTGFAGPALEDAFAAVAGADAVIAVSPAFNASFAGLFKSFFDVLPEETLSDMPVLIGATGGTSRHSLVLDHALRPLFSYLHAQVVPTGVYAATDDFGQAEGGAGLDRRVERAGTDLARTMLAHGPRLARDAFTEELDSMTALLNAAR